MTTAMERLTAALADRYRLERELGAGGMATVYLAEDLKHHRKVAVKVLRPELAASMGAERFEREIEVAARLTHPHILGVLDSGEAGGFFYYVMPYVEGETLRDRLTRSGELPVADALRLLSEIAEALAAAHKGGVVHRDIKPENILLSGRHAMVMDFGVAKAVTEASGRQQLTTAGVALGTPAYMAPEQATADPQLDHRVDIYALGVLAYEMLTGHPPFHGLTPQQTLAAHVTQAPVSATQRRPGISPALDALIMRCLAKRPADRYQTADDLVAALEPLATPSGGMTPTHTMPIGAVGAPRAVPRWVRGVIAGVVVILLGAAAFALWNRPPATAALLQPVQLTRSAGVQESPFITSDGKGVAYRILGPGDTASRVEWRRGSDGSAVTVAPIGRPRGWSSDGDRLLIATPRGLESVPALGGASTFLVAGVWPNGLWAPDGQRLVYVQGDSLLLRTSDGQTTLLARTFDPHSLAWSPDGRWIAYVSDNSIYLNNWNIATSSLWLVPSTGGMPTRLTAGDALDLSPAWAPDSRRLLFVSSRGGTRDIYQLNLDSRGRPRADPVRITLALNVSQISLSADGQELAYSVVTNRSNIWSVKVPATGSVTSRSAELVTTDQESIESIWISQDGQWLAFDSDRSGVQQIFCRPLAGGEVQQITRGNSPAFSVSLSPDGKEVAYHAIVDGHRRVFVAPSEGGAEPIQLSPGTFPDERNPSWSRDGRRLLWQTYLQRGVIGAYVITRSASGWGAPQVVASPGAIVGSAWADSVSVVARDTVNDRLILVNTEDSSGTPRVLGKTVTRIGNPSISTDGRTLYSQDRFGVWAVPVKGGVPREVVRFDDPLHPHATNARNLAAHAGRLYFTLQDPQSNIWMAKVTGLKR
ncbi:MAG: protein kinase [Gemmatimonadota bacterium]|nr:protein kinase [Gemmatimonadota bacterium]